MKLYLKICLISSVIMLTVIGTYSLLFSEKREEVISANVPVDETEIKGIIEGEKRNYIALACDSVCPNAPYLCKVAFCSVVINRCNNSAFPNTPIEVIYSDPTFKDAIKIDHTVTPTDTALMAYDDALCGFSPCPEALYFYTAETPDITLRRRSVMFQIGRYLFS